MYLFECKVLVNGIPTVMQYQTQNLVQEKNYFSTFGTLLNDPRIINGKT